MTRSSVHVLRDAAHVAEVAAELLANRMLARADLRLLMPTGSTPLPLYAALRRRHAAGLIPRHEGVAVFQLDEYHGVAAGDERSYRCYLRRELDGTGMELAHTIDANAPDIAAECARYQALLDEREIDVAVVGLGRDGHVGFDEPGSDPLSEVRVVRLAETTRADAADGFGGIENVPREAVTVGLRTLLEAREVLMLVTGAGKAETLHEALAGDIRLDVPASQLRLHPRLTVLCDEAAASHLTETSQRPAYSRDSGTFRFRAARSDRVLVVLGHRESGISREHRASRESFGRLAAAAGIAAREPVRAAVITGYTSTGGLSEAEQMAAEWPGNAPLLLEVAGRDTAENATRSLPLILALGGIRRATVVTSGWHYRAVPYFRPYRDYGLELDFEADWTGGGWARMLWNELLLTPRVGRTRKAAWADARIAPWLVAS